MRVFEGREDKVLPNEHEVDPLSR